MKHLLKLLLIAVIALPFGMTVSAQNAVTAVDKNLPQLTDESSATVQSKMALPFAIKKDDPSQKGAETLRGSGTPPSDAKIEQWTIQTNKWYKWNGYRYVQTTFWTSNVDVALYGNYIYIRGLSDYARTTWFKGTIDGTTASFGNYLSCGVNDDGAAVYLMGYNTSSEESVDIAFTYSLAEKKLTLPNNVRIWDAIAEGDGMVGCYSYQASGLTINASVSANEYCPIYGYYFERAQHSQMIYPESEIIFYKNSKLKSITFYTSSGIKFSGGSVTVKLAVIDQDRFNSASFVDATLTQVASITPSTSNTSAWKITFTDPFEYKGGNLLVDVTTTEGSYGSTSFYLQSTTNYQSYYNNANGNNRIKYLPVVTFEYERMYEERDITVLTPAEIAAIPYTWKENGTGTSHTGYLNDIATDPDQIIAMLKEVYTNKSIPGNLRRGFTTEGTRDHDDVVPYTAVGSLSVTNGTATFNDTYGWQFTNSEVIKKSGSSDGYNYWYMDPEQYKPNKEGLTLLLLEMDEDFTPVTVTQTDEATGEIETLNAVQVDPNLTGYAKLRDCVSKTIKSARIISEARRTGEGMGKGTMFKIDCDKMNKFYLIAKGKLLWFSASSRETAKDFYDNPCYINGNGVDKYSDYGLSTDYNNAYPFLCQMFEQFSPAISGSGVTKDDIYQEFTKNMQSFGVNHDCPNVPYVENGHHFMMYNTFSKDADCQDVRDMMFFIPDYRMMDHSNRAPNDGQDYFRYHPDVKPTMGMFVIKQNEIPEGSIVTSSQTTMTGIYKHQLSWKSNLDDFLPGDMQEYELWEIVVDDFGVESYQQVYYRNSDGSYVLDDNGNKVPIVLDRQNLSEFTYDEVYVDMKAGSQIKSYVIRGRDKGGFLSLQMSNVEEIIIPGLDPNEKAHMIGATYYSRYNPDNEKNCYSNKIELSNNGTTLTAEDLSDAQNKIYFYRSSRAAVVDENGDLVLNNGNIQYSDEVDKVLVATGTANYDANTGKGTITIVPESYNQLSKTEFPFGASTGTGEDKPRAGYHDNSTLEFEYTLEQQIVQGQQINKIKLTKNLKFWDNFTVDVSKNAHPLQYLYKMEVGVAYSNNVRIPVYKTDSDISKPFTLAQVESDGGETGNAPSLTVDKNVVFSEKVEMRGKSELLRYDVYRFGQEDPRTIVDIVYANGDESDMAPDGIAGNQGEYYTVTMNAQNTEDYYVAAREDCPEVSTTNPTAWARFIDKYPANSDAADEYTYAPVVELYTKGYKEYLVDNKQVERNDYNTYGGPQQSKAVGKFPLATPSYAKSAYTWPGDKTKPQYCYYDVKLQFSNAAVPAGYELYKVRAWRQVPTEYVGEEEDDYQYRLGAEIDGGMNSFKFDEITYTGEASNPCHIGTSSSDLGVMGYTLGQNKDSNNVYNYTFGARKVGTGDNVTNGIDIASLPVKFIVRAYFTKTNNLNGSKAGGDDKFYIVETVIEDEIKDTENVITEVNDLSSVKVVSDVIYFDAMGRASSRPHNGVNIVVTRYTDGTTSTTKVVK